MKITIILLALVALTGCDCMETTDDADAGFDTDTDTDTPPDAGSDDCALDIDAHGAACDLLGLYLQDGSIHGDISTAKAWEFIARFCSESTVQFPTDTVAP